MVKIHRENLRLSYLVPELLIVQKLLDALNLGHTGPILLLLVSQDALVLKDL